MILIFITLLLLLSQHVSASVDTPSQNAQVMDSSFNHKKLGLHLNGVFSVVGLKNGEVICMLYFIFSIFYFEIMVTLVDGFERYRQNSSFL